MFKSFAGITLATATALMLTGCASAPPAQPPTPPVQQKPPEPASQTTARAAMVETDSTTSAKAENLTQVERQFAEGLNQYNDGNYPNAIRIFQDPIFSRAWPELQVRSLKFLSFSYCVTNNILLCRRTFGQLLKLDPNFQLSSAESGHPIWGPAFRDAKAEASKASK